MPVESPLPQLDRPFATVQSPRYFYLAGQYKTALNHMIGTVVDKDGLCIIQGPVGSGKSTMVRFFIDWLNENLLDQMELGIIYNPSFSTDFQLLKAVCHEFGIGPKLRKDEQLQALREFLHQKSAVEGKTLILVIDEAHKLNGQQFEVVREFFNFSHNDHFHLQVILVGEAEPLRHKLKNKRAIVSRAMYNDNLGALSLEETGELIRYRLRVAGFPEDLFEPEALERVHASSRGIPRDIVKLGKHLFAGIVGVPSPFTAANVDAVIAASPEVFYHGQH